MPSKRWKKHSSQPKGSGIQSETINSQLQPTQSDPRNSCSHETTITDNAACPSCGWVMENLCISLALYNVPTRAWAFPEGTVPIIFEYCRNSVNRICVPAATFGQRIRMAVYPYIYNGGNEQPLYVRESSCPSNVSSVPGTTGTYVSALVDFPSCTPVTPGLIRDILPMLPREYGGEWTWQWCPSWHDYLMFRLRWFESNILRAAWAVKFWSNVPFQPDGDRKEVTPLLQFPSLSERAP